MTRLKIIIAILFFQQFLPSLCAQNLRINELMPSNRYFLTDQDKDYPDWFELKNTGTQVINLSGYAVSDDLNGWNRWVFPDYLLHPGEFLVVYASGKNISESPLFYHTAINQGDIWSYMVPDKEIPGWTDIDFDDSNWDTGPSGFGYSDNDDATSLPQTLSVYLRKEFTIEDTSLIKGLILHLDYDDGFVAYINDTEVARSNLSPVGERPAYNQVADDLHEALIYRGYDPEEFILETYSDIIRPGKNVLAVEVHNRSWGSSDISAIPFLSVLKPGLPENSPLPFLGSMATAFHTDFKLDSDADSLILFNPQGQIIDDFFFYNVPPDISLGYKPGNYSEVYGFTEATPWKENTGKPLFYSDPDPPVFHPPGGHFNQPFYLTLSNDDPLDTIFYTTDGSEPDRGDNLYTVPIIIDRTKTIRAKAVRAGKIPGSTVTHSYLLEDRGNLPFVFISTHPGNLFNNDSGIYVMGDNAEEESPYFGANFWNDWERPAHIEYFDIDGNQHFSIDGGIKIFGNYSRGHPQKSISVFARSRYGDKSINARLFEDSPLDNFEAIVLRNSGNEWFGEGHGSGVMFRDLFMTSVARDINVDAQAGRPVRVYLNGRYWGIHNMREKTNEHFVADNHGYEPEQINLLERDGKIIEGKNEHYFAMREFIRQHDMSLEENYDYVATLMDMDEFIRYCVLQIYYYNGDWPGNNIKFWRPDTETGKWRWIMFDTDFGFGLWDFSKVYHNTLDFATTTQGENWPNPPWSTFLLRSLLKNESFKYRFINTYADHLNTTLLHHHLITRIDSHASDISEEMYLHIDRWGGSYSLWERNLRHMRDFAKVRPGQARKHILEFFNIPESKNLKIEIDGSDTAKILLNTIKLEKFPWNGIYFENIPVELTAIPPEGFQFVRWTGDFESDSARITLDMDSDYNITAVFEPLSQGSKAALVINEIFYKSSAETNSGDWIEIYNPSENFVDLEGWTLRDNQLNNNFTFSGQNIMEPGGYLVVCRNMDVFKQIHPLVESVTGELNFGFSSDGDCIRLYDYEDELVDSVCYAPEYPWPTDPDGNGYSLSLKTPELDNSLAQNWYSSAELAGSPGFENSIRLIKGNKEIIEFPELRIYPNPFNKVLHIEADVQHSSSLRMQLIEPGGRIIYSEEWNNPVNGINRLDLDAGSIPKGLYIIKITYNEKSVFRKIFKY